MPKEGCACGVFARLKMLVLPEYAMNINEKSKFKHLTAFILVILAERQRSPRDVYTELLQDFPGFTIDMSTVYRCLSSLEKEGLVMMEWELPPEGAARKRYAITQNGKNDLYEWKEDIDIRKHNFEVFLQKFNALNGRDGE